MTESTEELRDAKAAGRDQGVIVGAAAMWLLFMFLIWLQC